MRSITIVCGIAVGLALGLAGLKLSAADPPPKTDADKVKALLKERREVLNDEWVMTLKREDIVPDKTIWLDQLCRTAEAILDVDLDLSATRDDRMAAFKNALEMAQKLEDNFKIRVERGLALPQDYLHAKETRLKIEINMTNEQIKQKAK